MSKIKFEPYPFLQTEKYSLRKMNLDDINEVFSIRSDKRVSENLDRQVYQNLEDAKQFIEMINTGIGEGKWIYWAICYKNGSKLIGTICLWNIHEDQSTADIGFELHPDYQGKGIMQEVIPIVLGYGFSNMGLEKIEGEVDPENIKSIKLMQKFGFVFDSITNGNKGFAIYYLRSKNWNKGTVNI